MLEVTLQKMTYTILSDDQVNSILEGLTVDELEEFRHVLASSLHEFSTGVPALEAAYQQPNRISTTHPETQAKTLYMPSCAPCGMGCKGEFTPQGRTMLTGSSHLLDHRRGFSGS